MKIHERIAVGILLVVGLYTAYHQEVGIRILKSNNSKLVANQITSLEYELRETVIGTGNEYLFWSNILQDTELYKEDLKGMEKEVNSILLDYDKLSESSEPNIDKKLMLLNRLGALRYKWYKSYMHLLTIKEMKTNDQIQYDSSNADEE